MTQRRRRLHRGQQPPVYYRPATPPGAAILSSRKPLVDMDPSELEQWANDRQARLIDHSRFVQAYLDRRPEKAGTLTNQEYTTFQELARDLIDALGEIAQAAIQIRQEEEE